MKLKNLNIKLNESWNDNAGKYTGTATWEQKGEGEFVVTIPADISEKLLIFLAPVLERHCINTAAAMQQSIMLSVKEAQQLPETTV